LAKIYQCKPEQLELRNPNLPEVNTVSM